MLIFAILPRDVRYAISCKWPGKTYRQLQKTLTTGSKELLNMGLVTILNLNESLYSANALYTEMRTLQHQRGYLLREDLIKVATHHNLHLPDVHALASFYPH